jgi:sulfoxide reductase heme-binding subunit YedZ
MLAFVLLVPLAITSTNNWMRRLGKRWKQLHQTVYIIGILAVLHYLWLVKADLREPLIYAGILLLLLGYRVNYKMLLRRIKQIPQFRLN